MTNKLIITWNYVYNSLHTIGCLVPLAESDQPLLGLYQIQHEGIINYCLLVA